MDERGYIQYVCDWTETPPRKDVDPADLIAWRQRLVAAGLMGVDHAETGTVAMATEIERLFLTTDLGEERFLVMGGHTDGLMSFGRTLDEAGEIILGACTGS